MTDQAISEAEVAVPAYGTVKPKPFEFVPLKWKVEASDDLPKPDLPYFLVTPDDFYLVKESMLGISVTKSKDTPPGTQNLSKGFKNGVFFYKAKPIPARVMSQAVDFFRKVWKRHGTEAELLFLFNDEMPEDKRWRLFVPAQKVSGGSVKSVYDPEDIPKGWYLVGSIHSHCNFSAFHSSIDTNDASTFNGLHITVGHVDKKKPEFAVMVSVNGLNFNYDSSIEVIADVTNLDVGTSPNRWMAFLFVEQGQQVGDKIKKHLRDKLDSWQPQKPTVTTTPTGPNSQNPPWSKPKSNSDFYPRTGYHAQNCKYSLEFKGNYPKAWFKDSNYLGSSELLPEKIPDAVDLLLEDLADVMLTYEFELEWNIKDLWVEKEDKKKQEEADREDSEAADRLKQLLPGPMEVKGDEEPDGDLLPELSRKMN